MKATNNSVHLIKDFEGLRLQEYSNKFGKLSIGYGHILLDNESFYSGITVSQADEILTQDVKEVEEIVNKNIKKLKINQHQFDALISFTHNLGEEDLCSLLKDGVEEVPNKILRCDISRGHIDPEVNMRRRAELALWNRG